MGLLGREARLRRTGEETGERQRGGEGARQRVRPAAVAAGARACSGGITRRLTLYASITDSRQKHAE